MNNNAARAAAQAAAAEALPVETSQAQRLVQLKAHLKGVILREIDLADFKYLLNVPANTNTLPKRATKKMPLIKALRNYVSLESLTALCIPRASTKTSVKESYLRWNLSGWSYSKNAKVVVALRGTEIGRTLGSSQGNLEYIPEVVGFAVYGRFTARMGLDDDDQDNPATYRGRWRSTNQDLNADVNGNQVGEIELICGKSGTGSLLVEYATAKLMAANRHRLSAVVTNAAGYPVTKKRREVIVFPIQNTIERMGFVPVAMDVVHGNAVAVPANQIVDTYRTNWFVLKGPSWRTKFTRYLYDQLQKFTPIDDASGFLCPAKMRTGVAYCT